MNYRTSSILPGFELAAARVIARFSTPILAETARQSISRALESAKCEVDDLFANQGGVADLADVSAIYARYGFTNENGWEQQWPLAALSEDLLWELPAGIQIDEVHTVLLAFGAEAVAMQGGDQLEHWREAPHPAAIVVVEDGWELTEDQQDDEMPRVDVSLKKVLH